MDKIVTHDTSTSQWQAIVIEASQACDISLSEEIQSYLVFLLMRFTSSPQMAQNIMALEFLKSQSLRDVGDQCLLYSGLFPGRAKRRRVRVSYYVDIGKSAYLSLAGIGKYSYTELFKTLAGQFVTLMDVLQSMRELDNNQIILDPIQAQELWADTRSNHALKTLQRFASTPAMPFFTTNLTNDKIKH